MGRYIRRRLLTAIPVFLGITLLVFGMLHLAAGSVLDLMGEGSASSAADKAALEASLGLDRPLPVQYLDWLSGLLRGDLGESYLTGKDVAGLIAQRVGPAADGDGGAAGCRHRPPPGDPGGLEARFGLG